MTTPLLESQLDPADDPVLEALSSEGVRLVSDAPGWARSVFIERRGQELWRALVVLSLLLLLAESWFAASGDPRTERS